MIKVFVLQLEEADHNPQFLDVLQKFIPEEGRLRVKDRLSNTSKLQTVAGELLARYSIADYIGKPDQEIRLIFNENGKPHIDNLINVHFNISHSGQYIVCAVGQAELGIDVERIRQVNLRIAERFFSPSEIQDLMHLTEEEKITYFITLWTIKESYLKAIGRGLTQHLNSFTIVKKNDSYLLTGNEEAALYGIETHHLPDDYLIAICAPIPFSPSEIRQISFKEIQKSLPKYI
jgi:4'-phosphopantetheinyl transferase